MKKSSMFKMNGLIVSVLVGLAPALSGEAAVLSVPNQYATIQGAVDAATSGDTIGIAAGLYEEQVLIVSKNLTLVGAPGAVLKATPGMVENLLPYGAPEETAGVRPLLAIVFSDDVVVRGLAVDGAHLGDVDFLLIGVVFHGSGGRMEHCTAKGFRGPPEQPSDAIAAAAGNFEDLHRPVQHVRFLNCLFEDNSGSLDLTGWGVAVSEGNVLRVRFVVQDNIIRGFGPTDAATQLGIRIDPGVAGEVKGNTIADHNCTGPAYNFSFGILAEDPTGNLTPLQPVRYEGNTFRNNQEHINSFMGNDSEFVNNTFQGSSTGTRPNGISASGDNLLIVNNDFSDMPTGITLSGDDPDFSTFLGIASNVKLIANRFCHVATPIDIEPLVTDVTQHGNKACNVGDNGNSGNDGEDN